MIEVKILDEVEELEVTGGDLVVTEGDIDLVHADKKLLLPLKNDETNPTLAFGDGDSGFYESSDNIINISINGTYMWAFTGDLFLGNINSSACIKGGVTSSATVPVHIFGGDFDTGLGHAGADALSLIAGGVEAWRGTEAAGAITHVLTDNVGITGDLDVTGNLEASKTFTRPATQAIAWGTSVVDLITSCATINTTGPGTIGVSLADGAEGQEKFFVMTVDQYDCTLTPANLANGTTITFDDVGDSAHLMFLGAKWVFMGGTATLA